MVLDDLSNYKRYLSLHPGVAIAFEFLKRQDLGQLPAGRNEVDRLLRDRRRKCLRRGRERLIGAPCAVRGGSGARA